MNRFFRKLTCFLPAILLAGLLTMAQAQEPEYHIKSIYFGGGSYYIDGLQKQELFDWLDGFEHIEMYEIVIQGHTDNIGSIEFNQRLSDFRTQAVYQLLIEYTIPSEMIDIKSFGEKDPVYDNATWAGKLKNRRADVILKPLNL